MVSGGGGGPGGGMPIGGGSLGVGGAVSMAAGGGGGVSRGGGGSIPSLSSVAQRLRTCIGFMAEASQGANALVAHIRRHEPSLHTTSPPHTHNSTPLHTQPSWPTSWPTSAGTSTHTLHPLGPSLPLASLRAAPAPSPRRHGWRLRTRLATARSPGSTEKRIKCDSMDAMDLDGCRWS